jgi:glyoxylase-like metal-dependent hydrolase (beta-lactamase superfamily II)
MGTGSFRFEIGEFECVSVSDARYFIFQEEWDFWNSDDAMAKAPTFMVDTARRNLDPLEDRLTFVDDTSEIVPGVRAVATFGHTL